MGTNSDSVRCAGDILGQRRHICAFFNSVDEEHRVLRSFIKEGFDRGDKAFHLVDPDLWEDHLRRLAEAGIDVGQAMSTGQLELRRWQDAQLRGDRFDQDAMLALIEEVGDPGAAGTLIRCPWPAPRPAGVQCAYGPRHRRSGSRDDRLDGSPVFYCNRRYRQPCFAPRGCE